MSRKKKAKVDRLATTVKADTNAIKLALGKPAAQERFVPAGARNFVTKITRLGRKALPRRRKKSKNLANAEKQLRKYAKAGGRRRSPRRMAGMVAALFLISSVAGGGYWLYQSKPWQSIDTSWVSSFSYKNMFGGDDVKKVTKKSPRKSVKKGKSSSTKKSYRTVKNRSSKKVKRGKALKKTRSSHGSRLTKNQKRKMWKKKLADLERQKKRGNVRRSSAKRKR